VPSFNLSTAKNLKYLALRFGRPNVQWITATLQTIESKNLQGIALQFGANAFEHTTTEAIRQQWHDLDHLLVQFWTSHSIRLVITCGGGGARQDLRDYASSLLPELTRRGLIDQAEYKH